MEKTTALSPLEKLQDYLARRDHSEKELKQKLSRFYSKEQIADAIETARDYGWLAPAGVLSERTADALHRRSRGIHKINQTLAQKGLPPVTRDSDLELEKARGLIERRFGEAPYTRETAFKAGRFLQTRGFDLETVRKLIFSGAFTPDDAE